MFLERIMIQLIFYGKSMIGKRALSWNELSSLNDRPLYDFSGFLIIISISKIDIISDFLFKIFSNGRFYRILK